MQHNAAFPLLRCCARWSSWGVLKFFRRRGRPPAAPSQFCTCHRRTVRQRVFFSSEGSVSVRFSCSFLHFVCLVWFRFLGIVFFILLPLSLTACYLVFYFLTQCYFSYWTKCSSPLLMPALCLLHVPFFFVTASFILAGGLGGVKLVAVAAGRQRGTNCTSW